jgi:hypothetical protein
LGIFPERKGTKKHFGTAVVKVPNNLRSILKRATWKWNTGPQAQISLPQGPGTLYHLTKAQNGDMLYFYTAECGNIKFSELMKGYSHEVT